MNRAPNSKLDKLDKPDKVGRTHAARNTDRSDRSDRAHPAHKASRVDQVIREIHASVCEERGWTGVLCHIRGLFRGRSVILARHDFQNRSSMQLCESPRTPSLKDAYSNPHASANPWFMSSMNYQAGRILTGNELIDPDDLVRSDFYRRFLASRGLVHWLCGVVTSSNDVVNYLAVHRARTQSAFSPGDKDLLRVLVDHLTIATKNQRTLLGERSNRNMLENVLGTVASAMFVVDRDGHVLLQNTGADRFLRSSAELQVLDSRLVAKPARVHAALAKAISNAAQTEAANGAPCECVISLAGEEATPPVLVSVRPVGKLYCGETGSYRGIAIVLARNPEHWPSDEGCRFSSMYGFTPAQTRLANLMLAGVSRRDAAGQLNVSENTIRSHLKQIYAKTDTHGQMELVHLHARVCTDH